MWNTLESLGDDSGEFRRLGEGSSAGRRGGWVSRRRLSCVPGWERYKFRSLKHCMTGGEALDPVVKEQWKSQSSLELHEGYGQSETVSPAPGHPQPSPQPASGTVVLTASRLSGLLLCDTFQGLACA